MSIAIGHAEATCDGADRVGVSQSGCQRGGDPQKNLRRAKDSVTIICPTETSSRTPPTVSLP